MRTGIYTAWLFGLAACNSPSFGTGIGRPPIEYLERPQLERLEIAEIFFPTNDPAARYAELWNLGSASIDLEGFRLVGGGASLGLSGVLPPSGDTGWIEIGLGGLEMALSGAAGELAIEGPSGEVHAYLAWGVDPAVLGSNLASRFLASGRLQAGAYVPTPYPLPSSPETAVINIQGVQGCGEPSPGSKATGGDFEPDRCVVAVPVNSALRLTELVAPIWSQEGSWVELASVSSVTLDLCGVRLCRPNQCVHLGCGVVLDPGARVLVHLGVDPPEGGPAEGDLYFPEAEPLRGDDELALLAPSGSELEPESFQAYVAYGVMAEVVTAASVVATAAGIWGSQAVVAPVPEEVGEGLSLDEDLTLAPGDEPAWRWYASFATPGVSNHDVSSHAWHSCSYPAPWVGVEQESVAIVSLARTSPAWITVRNRGGQAIDAANVALALGTSTKRLADTERLFASGEELSVVIAAAVEACPGSALCWVDPALEIGEGGEASLIEADGAGVLHHLQWGTATRVRTEAAVEQGLWPLLECSLPPLGVGETVLLAQGRLGSAPGDYEIE